MVCLLLRWLLTAPQGVLILLMISKRRAAEWQVDPDYDCLTRPNYCLSRPTWRLFAPRLVKLLPDMDVNAKSIFENMLAAVSEGRAKYAMVPVENLLLDALPIFIIYYQNQAFSLLANISRR